MLALPIAAVADWQYLDCSYDVENLRVNAYLKINAQTMLASGLWIFDTSQYAEAPITHWYQLFISDDVDTYEMREFTFLNEKKETDIFQWSDEPFSVCLRDELCTSYTLHRATLKLEKVDWFDEMEKREYQCNLIEFSVIKKIGENVISDRKERLEIMKRKRKL